MDDQPKTRTTLLLRLQTEPDQDAWSDFVDIYSPVVFRVARRNGLQDADASDLVQDVLQSVFKSLSNYDVRRGLFRNWLMGVVKNRLNDFRSRHRRAESGSGDTEVQKRLEEVPAATEMELEALWDQEYQAAVFQWAVKQVRGRFEEATWRAFWGTRVEGRSTKDVAAELGMTEGAVYIAKSRVLASLRKAISEIRE